MPDELLTRAAPESVTAAPEGRTIDVRIMRYGEVAQVSDEGGPAYQETFARGAFAGVDPARVTLEAQRHGGPLVGVASTITESGDDVIASFRVAATRDGDDLLELARAGVLTDASVFGRATRSGRLPNGVIERQALDLRRVAILERGAYPSASVLVVRAEGEETPMPPEIETPTVDLAPIAANVETLLARMGALETLSQVPNPPEAPLLYRHESLGEYMRAAYRDETGDLSRALADNLSSENAGLAGPQWLSQIQGIVELGRRGINAMGGPEDAGPTGLKVSWPQFNGVLTGLVAKQATQKTEVQSGDISFTEATASLETYAGGGDIAIQLIERASPDYLSAWTRVATAAWAMQTDSAFAAQLLAGATGAASYRSAYGAAIAGTSTAAAADDILRATSHGLAIGDAITFLTKTGGTGVTLGETYWVMSANFAANTFQVSATPGGASIDITVDMTAYTFAKLTDATGMRLRSALFEASTAVENATGVPATTVLASTDQFLMMAGMSGIVPTITPTNPSNASGIGNADTLRINVSGLEIVREPGLAAGKLLVSNALAARWREDGPRTITANEVAKLGRDVAIYSYGITALYIPAGIVVVSAV